ncbi:MAG: hypothetical protein JW830_15765 [Bacteroidales bacterium]|nr:hypothetical protein [Bacteroidales bacterium]
MNQSLSENKLQIPDHLHPDLIADFKNIESLDHIQTILNSISNITAVVNKQKKVIVSNEHLVKTVGLQSLDEIIGHRPGEFFHCIHVTNGGTCTATDNCRFCGINQTIHESQKQNKRISGECRITTRADGRLMSYDFRVTCVPLLFNGEHYTLLNLLDISSEKRNEMLEKVFFHDLLNRLGGFDGIIKIIKSENKQPELDEFIDLLNTIGELTIEDIQTQRMLRAAENADLILNIRNYSSSEIIESVRKQISYHPSAQNKKIVVCSDCEEFIFKTDGTLLKRILLNMVKNAAEATQEGESIELISTERPETVVFSVRNAGVIPDDIRLQIFQRSFSTKGPGRGLGTYSMKLFGENYLRGKVYFTSEVREGTVFTVELPAQAT